MPIVAVRELQDEEVKASSTALFHNVSFEIPSTKGGDVLSIIGMENMVYGDGSLLFHDLKASRVIQSHLMAKLMRLV